MVSKAKYLTDKSVIKPILGCVGISVFGVVFWAVAPEGYKTGFWVGLVFVLLGIYGAVVNLVSSCWYPVFSDKALILRNYLLPWRRRVVPYEDVLYAKVAEFKVRRWDLALVLTVKTKDGKTSDFILMTRLEQLGQLGDEIRSRGVPDTYEPEVAPGERKKYLSTGALVIQLFFFAVILALFCWLVVKVSWPLLIVMTILFVPFMIFQLFLLSYVVIDGRRIMLKYLVFRKRDLEISFDDAYDINIGPSSHFSALLKSPDKKGRTRVTRLIGLLNVNMIQEINAYLKSQNVQIS
jgi:hypothetical protein